jgi:hypothetical protein
VAVWSGCVEDMVQFSFMVVIMLLLFSILSLFFKLFRSRRINFGPMDDVKSDVPASQSLNSSWPRNWCCYYS